MDTLLEICCVSVPTYGYEVKQEDDSCSATSLSALYGKLSRVCTCKRRFFFPKFVSYKEGSLYFLVPENNYEVDF
jgi:hypothetical protein